VNFAVLFVYIGALFATLVLFLNQKDSGVFGLGPQGLSGIFMAITVVAAGTFMFLGGYASDRLQSRVPTLLFFLGATSPGSSCWRWRTPWRVWPSPARSSAPDRAGRAAR